MHRIRWGRIGVVVGALVAVGVWIGQEPEPEPIPEQQVSSLLALGERAAAVRGYRLVIGEGDRAVLAGVPVSVLAAIGDWEWELFESALGANGFRVELDRTVARIVGGAAPREEPVTQVVQLVNARAEDVVPIVQAVIGVDCPIAAHAATNTLVLTAPATAVRRAYRVLKGLDVPSEPRVERYLLDHVPADDALRVLVELYPPSADSTLVLRAVDDERTNTLFVLASPQGHHAVRAVVDGLDATPAWGVVPTVLDTVGLRTPLLGLLGAR